MRIYVEYNKNDPNLVRVQHRNAGLAIIPAGSIAVVGWLGAAACWSRLALLDKWLDRRDEGADATEIRPRKARTCKFRMTYARRQPYRQATLTL